jgi:hypothetical protein
MRHAVVIWAGTFNSEEELMAYTESIFDEETSRQSSDFMEGAGIEELDEDFIERHYISDAEERRHLVTYLRHEYAEDSAFAEHLPDDLESRLAEHNSVILLYGNDSPYGPVNEGLLQEGRSTNTAASFKMVLIADIQYESLVR